MILKFSLGAEGGTLTVQRELDDPKAKASGFTKDVHGWGPEIHLLSMLVRLLNSYGFNLASLKVTDDGHLYGDNHMRYLRTPTKALRKSDVPYPYLYIIDGDYMLRSSAEAYNNSEELRFEVHGNVFDDYSQPDWYRKVKALCNQHGIECELHEPAVA
jgi:hypothetical protein